MRERGGSEGELAKPKKVMPAIFILYIALYNNRIGVPVPPHWTRRLLHVFWLS